MKNLRNILCGCMAFSFWIVHTCPSAIFFGEYPYPKQD